MSGFATVRQWLLGLGAVLPGLAAAQDTTAPAAVAQAYLYVEPYQARVEVLFDAATVLRWQNPRAQLPPPALNAEAQKGLTEKMAKAAGEWCQLLGDGQPLAGAFLGAAIIKGQPGNTVPFEEGTEIPLNQAMVGLTWEFPTPAAPGELTLIWQGFQSFPAAQLPVKVFFGPRSESLQLSRDQPRAAWKSEGRIPEIPPLTAVPPVPAKSKLPMTLLYAAAGGLGVALLYFILAALGGWPRPGKGALITLLWILACLGVAGRVVSKTKPAPAAQTPAQAKLIVGPLLRNVYRAFDHRMEGEIYDVLARSVSGTLLRTLYLETIQALTLEGREGTRVTINNFDAEVSSVHPLSAGFAADCQWTALGTVGHWGHTHTRVNRYTARVTVTPEPEAGSSDRAWKITGLEVTETRRL